MKRGLFLLMLILPISGCVTATSTTPTNATAASIDPGPALAGATKFYDDMQVAQATGSFKPTAAEVTAFNILQSALSVANPLYLAYKAGTGTLAAAQAAADKVATANTAAYNLVYGVK